MMLINPSKSQLFSHEQTVAIVGFLVDSIIAENFPGSEGRTSQELEQIAYDVHTETVQQVATRQLAAADAPAYTFKRIHEELQKTT